jgi:hypothetical protein
MRVKTLPLFEIALVFVRFDHVWGGMAGDIAAIRGTMERLASL